MPGMPEWELDGIRFNTKVPDSDGVTWWLEDEEGFWGSAALAHQFSARLQRHGSWRVPGWKERDPITLTCSAYAPRGDYMALRRAQLTVAALCSDPLQDYALTCYAETGALAAGVVLDGDILTKQRYVQQPAFEFSLQLTAPDPRKYAPEWIPLTTGLPADTVTDGLDFGDGTAGSGLDFGDPAVATAGLDFGVGAARGFITLTNIGKAPTSPLLELHGPLIRPSLTCVGGALTYTADLAAGEFLLIDPEAYSALLGGTAARSHLLDPADFDAFVVPPEGELAVGLSHAGLSTATGYAVARYRPAWF